MKQNNFRNKPQRKLEKQWKKRKGHNDFELQTYAQADGNSRKLELTKKHQKVNYQDNAYEPGKSYGKKTQQMTGSQTSCGTQS